MPPVIARDPLMRPDRAAVPRRRSWSSDESDSGSERIHFELVDVDVDPMEA
jgi:hypothetical protein